MYKRDRLQRTNLFASNDLGVHPIEEGAARPSAANAPAPPVERPAALPGVYVRQSRATARRAASQPDGASAAVGLTASFSASLSAFWQGGIHPPAVPLSEQTKVRFWRTPRHLMQQIWGTAVPGMEPAAEAAPEPFEPIPATIAVSESDGDDAVDDLADWADEAAFLGDTEPGPAEPVTPFAFLSDHAFWDLVPAIEQHEDVVAPSAPAQPPAPVPVPSATRPAPAPARQSRPSPAPAPRPEPVWQGYSVNLSFSMPSYAPSAPAAPVPQAPQAMTVAAPAESEPAAAPRPHRQTSLRDMKVRAIASEGGFQLPPIEFLAEPPQTQDEVPVETLQQNSGLLEGVLEDFNVKGEIVQACPGPVVTLYELEPAPGTKSSRVISLADDIARS
ncbi:hypothetical protein SAMN05880592_1111, partial [Bosea sp. TND4EK4]